MLDLGDYHPAAVRGAVALLLAQDRDAEADRILEQAARAGALAADLLRPAAEIALRAGRRDRAAQLARSATPQSNPSYRDLVWLGRILGAAGRASDAELCLREATRMAPEAAATWLALVAHHHRQGQREEAEAAVERMKESVAKEVRSLALGRAYEVLGRHADAEKAYKAHLALQPRDAEALWRLAELYLRRDETDRAEPVLTALLDSRVLVPEEDLPHIRRTLALALTSPARREDRSAQALALLALNRAARGDTQADRRVAALVKGSRPAARAEALAALEAMSGGPAVTAQERLRLALLYEDEGRWVDARKQYAALVAADRENPAYVALLVEGLLRQKKMAEAASWLERLEKLEPGSARAKGLLAQVRKAEAKGED
jgi:tetratricopeptide (TPR) repeat protein